MIDRPRLLRDLQVCARELERSLRDRLQAEPALRASLEAEHKQATEAQRTSDAWVDWLDERLAQVAASWVLACVFVRFLEDNDLIEPPRLAGRGDRLQRARDQETLYFRKHTSHGHREYLEHVLREVSALPGLGPLLGEGKNPLWTLGPTADGARELLEGTAKRPESLRQRDPATGELVHDYTDPAWDTRFLGDLYQDLSELARERYALLQTPHFVESFILDRTLEPALAEFGLPKTSLIDPACGSGHFLLGAFQRLVGRWQAAEPGTNAPALAQKALDQLAGVDVNPFAVAITRFRLLLAALQASGVTKLRQAFGFTIHVTTGDSLLHGPRPGRIDGRQAYLLGEDPLAHVYKRIEDPEALRRILSQRYGVVVANPPYPQAKDKALNQAYRERFGSCHGKYSLAVPFKERCFDLVRWQGEGEPGPAGYVGLITANSFMKREFGKKLIEEFFPRWDLTHVLDTSGLSEAALVGHLTPTVILLARGRRPVATKVRTVRSIRSEPSWPEDPSSGGVVWDSITSQLDHPGSKDAFTSVDDVERETFHKHPWSLGGGGAAELKERFEEVCERSLAEVAAAVGVMAVTGEDEVYAAPRGYWEAHGLRSDTLRPFIEGDAIRDWVIAADRPLSVFSYTANGMYRVEPSADRHFWLYRTSLSAGVYFGQTKAERGMNWREYAILVKDKLHAPLSIAYAEVATHNHFALDRGGRVFNQSAPVIKLPPDATEDDHLVLLSYLNSSPAIFWLKQVCALRGKHSTKVQSQAWGRRSQLSATQVGRLPIPNDLPAIVTILSRRMCGLIDQLQALAPETVIGKWAASFSAPRSLDSLLKSAHDESYHVRRHMVSIQEEIDWACYGALGLLDVAPALVKASETWEPLEPTARPFEILLARRVLAGDEPDYWFTSLDRSPRPDIPSELSPETSSRFEARLALISESQEIRLLEAPECKRKWEPVAFAARQQTALRRWLLDCLESRALWNPDDPKTRSCAQIADALRGDRQFQQVAAVYRGTSDYDLTELVAELVSGEAVPLVSALRYTAKGLEKRRAWEETWRLQRLEDTIDARAQLPEADPAWLTLEQVEATKRREVGSIPVPPKYAAPDFQSQVFWRHRDKLDVPKERFLLVSLAEKEQDPTPVIGWAGWDHLQRAKALAALFLDRKDRDGWTDKERLAPILLAVHELVPWLLQWHDAIDPAYGRGLGTYFKEFVEDEARALGLTVEALAAWVPPARSRGRRAPKAALPDDEAGEAAAPPAPKRSRKPVGGAQPDDGPAAPRRGRKKKATPAREQVAPDADDS